MCFKLEEYISTINFAWIINNDIIICPEMFVFGTLTLMYHIHLIILGGCVFVSIFVAPIDPKMDDFGHFQADSQSY